MKIRMLSPQKGSLDGCHVMTYENDKEYDLTGTDGARSLAAAFVAAGMAAEVGRAAPVAAEPEQKAIEAAPENKAMAAPAVKRQYNRKG